MNWLKFGNKNSNGRSSPEQPVEPNIYSHPEVRRPELITNYEKMVTLPPGVDEQEWMATHTLAIFHNVDRHFSVISELCTAESCPTMKGPQNTTFLWVDEKNKKIKCTAPQYIDYAMAHCQQMVTDQTVFPTKYEQKFSTEFSRTISKMLRLIWHVISHIYHSHYQAFYDLGLVGHLNMTTLHFVLFAEKFNLINEKEFLPLEDLIVPLKKYAIPSPESEETEESLSDH